MKKRTKLSLTIFIMVIALAGALYMKKSREKEEKKDNIKIEEVNPDIVDDNKDKLKALEDEDSFFINSEKQFDKIIKEDKPTILMFGTKACTYCAQMRPYVNELSNLYKDKINIRYIDAGRMPDLAYRYPIKGVPAFMLQNYDKTGFTPSEGLFDELSENYNNPTAYSQGESKKHDFTFVYGLMSRDLTEKIIVELIDYDK